MHILSAVARAMAAVFMAAGFLYVAYAVGLLFCSSRGILVRWVATIAALLILPTALFHLLALPHLFAPGPAILGLFLFAAIAIGLGGRGQRLRGSLARDALFVTRVATLVRRSPHRGMIIVFFVCAAPGLVRALLLPPLGWDSLTYHAVKAGMWVQNGGVDSMFGTGPWGYYQNMLAGGEVFSAWAMLPLHSDALAPAVEVAQWLALGLVMFVLARRFSIGEPFASAAVGFFLALPTVKLLVGSGYVELSLLLAFTTGVTLGLEAWAGAGSGTLALALGALGVAAATKMSMVPLAAVLAVVFTLGAVRTVRWAGIGTGALAFAVALVPWMVRTIARTGLPFSPLPLKVGPLILGQATPELLWYMRRQALRPYLLETELSVLGRLFAVPGTAHVQVETLGAFALLPLFASLPGLRRLTERSRPAMLVVGLTIVFNLAFYYSPDFSMIRHYWTESSSRFLLPLVALLTLVSVAWCRPRSHISRLYLACLRGATLANLVAAGFIGFSAVSIKGIAILLAGATAVAILAARLAKSRVRAVSLAVLAVAALLGLQSLRGWLRDDLFARDFVMEPVPKYWTPAVPLVDDPDAPRRIAITSGPLQNLDNWFAAPFLGRQLQNAVTYQPLSADGKIWPLGGEDIVRTASFEAWKRRLHDHHVTEVMSFTPRSMELEWMEAHPDLFEKRCGDHEWGLFRLK